MSTATFELTATPAQADSPVRSVLRTAVTPVLVAASAAEAFTLVARWAGVPMRAADPGAGAAKAIPVGGIAMAVLANAIVGVLAAVVLARLAKSPAKTFAVVATSYAALSLLGPAFAAHTHVATKLVLTVAHLIAAAVIIPPVSKALAPRPNA